MIAYLINFVGIVLLFLVFTGVFKSNLLGSKTTYIMGICTTACYTVIMVASLNILVGIMGEFSLGHAGFMSVGAYASAIVTNALAGAGLPNILLLSLHFW